MKRVDKREGRWQLTIFLVAFFAVWTLRVVLLSPLLNPPHPTFWLEIAGIAVKWALWVLPVVSLPASEASALDPEEAFVSSRSRCHVLWFVSVAVKHGLRASRYKPVSDKG
jgi:hypothetical protein